MDVIGHGRALYQRRLSNRGSRSWPVSAAVLLAMTTLAYGAAVAQGSERAVEVQRSGFSPTSSASNLQPLTSNVQSPTPDSSSAITTTRVISYTYDPLNRFTGADSANRKRPILAQIEGQHRLFTVVRRTIAIYRDYSTGESYEYAYDAVGHRTAFTQTTALAETTVTTYTYDAANRLTQVGDVVYTWDAWGNLTNDGVFIYTYNAADRMVRAESVTSTLVYAYNATGLCVAQDADGVVITFAWDWASGIPEMLAQSTSLYLVGHETLGK